MSMEQNSDRPGDFDSSQSRGRESPVAAVAGGRLTRSRARELGQKLEIAASPELGGREGKKRQHRMEEDHTGLEPHLMKGSLKKQKDEKGCMQKPKSIAAGDPTSNLLTPRIQVERRSDAQASSIKGLLAGAPWLVHVSSTSLDGKEILGYSGVVIHCDKEKTWILTSYLVVFCTLNDSLYDPMPKLAVHLLNNDIYEGNMVFFSEHYRLAVLEIKGATNFEMGHPPYGSNPGYGDEVSTLVRDENLSLTLCCGTIKWLEEDHFMFPNYKLCPCGIGGPVIDNAGNMVGMSCDDDGQDPFILRITTIQKCIDMWKFGCILRPALGMCFRTLEFLDLGLQDCLRNKYGVNNGFIVDAVTMNSTAERRGIRRGDVITSFHGKSCHLPEFEDFLLSIGMDSLKGLKVHDLKLEVHNLLQQTKRTIFLPVQFSDGSEY